MSDDAPPHDDTNAPPDEPPAPREPPLSARERVNAVLGRCYRIQHEIDAYDVLHDAEIARLTARRARAVGPLERRVARLKRFAEQFAVHALLDFGIASHRFPNGDITSNPVKPTIDKDDPVVAAAGWAQLLPADTIEYRPWVDMKKLRAWLERMVADGYLQRLVAPVGGLTDDNGDFWLVDERDGWTEPLAAGDAGFWFWTAKAAEALDGIEEGHILEGVTWAPNGTMGSGRNFKIKL